MKTEFRLMGVWLPFREPLYISILFALPWRFRACGFPAWFIWVWWIRQGEQLHGGIRLIGFELRYRFGPYCVLEHAILRHRGELK